MRRYSRAKRLGRRLSCFTLSPSLFIVLVIGLAGCRPSASPPEHQGSATPAAIEFQDARHLALKPIPGGYELSVNATFDDGGAGFTFNLRTETSAREPGVVTIPVRRVVTMSSTHLGFLGELDSLDVIVGVTRASEVASPAIRKGIREGSIAEVGNGPQLNLEKVIAARPDVVLAYGVSQADLDGFEPIRRAGIPVLVCADYVEPTPLARAEWIRLLGILVGKKELADERYAEIKQAYRSLAEKARKAEPRPKVLLNASFQGTWYLPGGDSYMARFVEDAGGAYLWADDRTARVLRLDFESVLERASGADVWLNVGMWQSLADGTANDARYALFSSFKNGQVYNSNRQGDVDQGNDFYERGAARPDLVLADLVQILHPSLLPSRSMIWYHRLQATSQASKGVPPDG